ncbi:hypothetical protein L6452_35864 [Arctium lappa]|uniref:Uncharacterized protein n=1 Tax=Arctium lappa TaxID=4217 RepID=A0ACB8Y941_ARCLA|nr:hypothetical protein L6452_35864 [Arctium lappa]
MEQSIRSHPPGYPNLELTLTVDSTFITNDTLVSNPRPNATLVYTHQVLGLLAPSLQGITTGLHPSSHSVDGSSSSSSGLTFLLNSHGELIPTPQMSQAFQQLLESAWPITRPQGSSSMQSQTLFKISVNPSQGVVLCPAPIIARPLLPNSTLRVNPPTH